MVRSAVLTGFVAMRYGFDLVNKNSGFESPCHVFLIFFRQPTLQRSKVPAATHLSCLPFAARNKRTRL